MSSIVRNYAHIALQALVVNEGEYVTMLMSVACSIAVVTHEQQL